MTETVGPMKPKIFIIWSFLETDNLWFRAWMRWEAVPSLSNPKVVSSHRLSISELAKICL